jgi:hypothetical protein
MTAFGLFTQVSHDDERSWCVELNNIDGRPMRECTARGFFEKEQNWCDYVAGQWWGYVRPMLVDDIEEELDVHNIEVEEDNSYVCENLIVHNCNFNASGDTVISSESIEWVEKGVFDPQFCEHWDKGLFTWWHSEKNKRYFITADVARGDGKDYSTFSVWNCEEMEQCAEYYGKIPVEEFAHLIVDIGHRYNNALVVIENNNIGMACLEHIRLAGYENLYYSNRDPNRPAEAVHSSWGATSDQLVIGFVMSMKVRPLVISKLEEFIRNRIIGIRSKRLLEEMRTFIWEKGKPQAMKGYNDDAMLAAAIACWVKDTFISPGSQAITMSQRLLENIGMTGHTTKDVPGATKNPDHVTQRLLEPFITTGNAAQPYSIRIPYAGQKTIDLKWLIK